jgi:parallel beta-helix repeat protein
MKYFSSLIISLIFVTTLLYAQTNVNGNVSGTWTLTNSPYIATNNLVLQPTDTLIIEPGVDVKFDGNYRFDIFGTFLAVGTESDSITFTRNGSTNWMSLNFADDADDNSLLQYCIIEYGSESGYDPYWGVVNFNLSSPTISNSRISNCSDDGIYLHYSDALVSNNYIRDISSEGIKLNQSQGTITGNTLNSINSSSIYLDDSDSTLISNNTISNNGYYGVCLYSSNDNVDILNNTISNNDSYGIYLQSSSNNVDISNNTILGMLQGVSILVQTTMEISLEI